MPILDPGDTAPDFSATTHDGRTVRLSDLRGRNVVLWFYPKADTPGCTAQGCLLRDRSAELDRKNVTVLGVSFDAPKDNKAFADKFSFPFPLLSDQDRAIAMQYGAADDANASHAKRVGYLIGPEGKVSKVWPKADPKSFADDALALL